MDDDDDDVFHTDPLTYQPPFRDIKCENRGTQTPGPALVQGVNMLPCGVAHEPRRLFYGKEGGIGAHGPARVSANPHPQTSGSYRTNTVPRGNYAKALSP